MADGYIKIYRQVRQHWTYKRSEYFHAWFEMLACAKYTPEPETRLIEGQLVTINYGEFVFGRTSWSKRLNIPETVLRGLIQKLVRDGMIELVGRYNKCTVYRIQNYGKFNQRTDQQTNQQQTLDNQGIEGYSDQQINQRLANRQPAGNHTQESRRKSRRIKQFINDSFREIKNFRQRYDDETLQLIDDYLDILRTTRVSNRISDSVICKVYEQMSKYPVIVVKYACNTIINNPALHSKKENYFFGIMRNTQADEAAEKLRKYEAEQAAGPVKPNPQYMRLKELVNRGSTGI